MASFPTGPALVDDFNRADQAPPGAALTGETWLNDPVGDGGAFKIASNQLAGTGSNGFGSGYLPDVRGPSVRAALTLARAPVLANSTVELYLRMQSVGSASADFWMCRFGLDGAAAGLILVAHLVDVGTTEFRTLTPATGSQSTTWNDGDMCGAEIYEVLGGTFIRMLRKAAAGSWTELATYFDTTVGRTTAAGPVGLEIGTGGTPANAPLVDDLRLETIIDPLASKQGQPVPM
jgi:hypothetical protein